MLVASVILMVMMFEMKILLTLTLMTKIIATVIITTTQEKTPETRHFRKTPSLWGRAETTTPYPLQFADGFPFIL